jgi:outer membrane protein assembly factor BamB
MTATRRTVTLLALFVLLAAACDWSTEGFDAARTGSNPFERTIGVNNVGTLQEAAVYPGVVAPIKVGESLVAQVRYGVRAFDAAAVTGCSGTPRVCSPQWHASPGFLASKPAAGDGFVFVGTEDTFFAYDAQGESECSTAPDRSCGPVWISNFGPPATGSPVVSNGVVFASSGFLVNAYSTNPSNCEDTSPRVCPRLWYRTITSQQGAPISSPAVANGHVFVWSGFEGTLTSLDATTGAIAWTAPVSGNGAGIQPPPTIANGRVYIESVDGVYAFDAAGSTGCAGPPGSRTCTPLFSLAAGHSVGVAIANGRLYAAIGEAYTGISVFDATGVQGCAGTPKVCQPLWTAPVSGRQATGAPVVANGVVYVNTNGSTSPDIAVDGRVQAFDAAGVQGCTGTPTVCQPLWTRNVSSDPSITVAGSPVVVDGAVYVAGRSWAAPTNPDGVHAYRLP